MRLLRHLASLPPRETWRLVRRRLPVLRNAPPWTAADLLASVKHRQGVRFAELLLRQEAILTRETNWKPLDFEAVRVVEIGCGPLAGYGPLAVFRGAASYESAEPEWDPDLFTGGKIAQEYLYPLHADFCALYGPRMDFETFRTALREKIAVHCSGFEAAPIGGQADIVLSQSCMEHVFPLEATIDKLAEIQTPQTRFLHLVDFGNHYLTPSPFDGLYEQPPEAYIARRGKAINMLRSSDILTLFENSGIPARMIPSRVVPDAYSGTIHAWWRERYDDEALFTQLALVASTGE